MHVGLDEIPDGVLVADESGRIIQMNVYMADLKGMGITEMLGLQLPNGTGRATR